MVIFPQHSEGITLLSSGIYCCWWEICYQPNYASFTGHLFFCLFLDTLQFYSKIFECKFNFVYSVHRLWLCSTTSLGLPFKSHSPSDGSAVILSGFLCLAVREVWLPTWGPESTEPGAGPHLDREPNGWLPLPHSGPQLSWPVISPRLITLVLFQAWGPSLDFLFKYSYLTLLCVWGQGRAKSLYHLAWGSCMGCSRFFSFREFYWKEYGVQKCVWWMWGVHLAESEERCLVKCQVHAKARSRVYWNVIISASWGCQRPKHSLSRTSNSMIPEDSYYRPCKILIYCIRDFIIMLLLWTF